MKAKVYIGLKKYAVYIGRKIVDKTLEFLTLPVRFISNKVQNLKNYLIYGKSIQSNLPEGYTQLESLSSTGYEYINTGLIIKSEDEIQLDYEYLGPTPSELSADMMFFGCQNTDTSRGGVWVEIYRRTTGSPSWYVRFGSTTSSSKTVDDQYITDRHLMVLRDSYFAIDGNLIHQPSNIGTFQTTPLTLFGRLSQTGEQLNASKIKVYRFKVVNNGVVRLNLIPCKNTENILGMYDTVTEQFLVNSGTGAFISGNAIGLPDEYTQLEYVVADGKAYVDTGFKANTTTTRFVGAFRLTDTSVSQGFFGSRNSNSANDGSCLVLFATGGSYVRGDWISGAANPSVPVTGNTIITFDITRGYGVINGAIYTSTKSTSVDQTNNFYVGHFRNGDGTMFGSGIIGHIFPCQLISNDVVIRNLSPAKRNSDGKIGMYDIINDVFYPSAGESEFTAGPVFSLKPTPTEPIAIESVGDRTKNMFDKATITKGAYLNPTGQRTVNANFGYGDYIKVEPGKTYTISGKSGGTSAGYRRIHGYDGSQTWLKQILAQQVSGGADYTLTFTAEEDCEYIRFSGVSATNNYTEVNGVQVEEGSVATSYEPYGYKIPVNINSKNLFNKDGEITNWYSSARVITTASANRTLAIRHIPGTEYYYKHCNVAGGGRYFYTNAENPEVGSEASVMYGTTIIQPNQVVHVQDLPDDTKWVFFNAGRSGQTATTQEQLDDYMVTTTPIDENTPYEPYFNQTTNIYLSEPLRKLGDLIDYIDFENQKVVRQVGELTFNGSESWAYWNTSAGKLFRTVVDSKFASGNKSDLGAICDHYKTVVQASRANNTMTGIDRNVDLINNNFSDVDSWKSELATNNVTVVYPLATSIEESITLPVLNIEQGSLIIDTDTQIKPSKLTITGDVDYDG